MTQQTTETRTPAAQDCELSVVMPCLNEADTVAHCVRVALEALKSCGAPGEVVVADNGSTDSSPELAQAAGARVIHVTRRGYGAALMAGIEASRGKYILMGDADESYDFAELPRFLAQLRAGHELVQGCRLPSGGGRVLPEAMPWSHRWLGNPFFSMLVRWWYHAPIHDVYCGMRGFTRDLYARLNLRCTGMEFAPEMIIKASMGRARFAEVPITLHPDGRVHHGPHLRTLRDGWRTLRFLLLYSPRWLFLVPGSVLIVVGLLGYALAMPGIAIHGAHLDAHTLLFASLAILCGFQAILLGLLTKTFAIAEGLLPEDEAFDRFLRFLSLERGVAVASATLAVGLVLLAMAVRQWWLVDFGTLDYARTMRWFDAGDDRLPGRAVRVLR
jgi:glycosyltransferase involved in cell wall biosynthesis